MECKIEAVKIKNEFVSTFGGELIQSNAFFFNCCPQKKGLTFKEKMNNSVFGLSLCILLSILWSSGTWCER